MRGAIKSWTDDQLIEAVRSSFSLTEVSSKLYQKASGSNYETIKKHVSRLSIDCSHFVRLPSRKVTDQLLFVCRPSLSGSHIGLIRDRFRELVPYLCEQCGNPGIWEGAPLTLQMDHRNGDRKDNRLENLRWICPNCHSQTINFGSRNWKSRVSLVKDLSTAPKVALICGCGKPFQLSKSVYEFKRRRGQDRFYCSLPCFKENVVQTRNSTGGALTIEVVLQAYRKSGTYVGASKILGVSDSYIRRLIKKNDGISSNLARATDSESVNPGSSPGIPTTA